MNFGESENKRVKQNLVTGLFSLLETKSFSEISVTELIEVSNVARASYYRNFDNMEAILNYYFQSLPGNELEKSIHSSTVSLFLVEDFAFAFHIFFQERDKLIKLINAGLASYLYNLIYDRVVDVAGDMPFKSIERYKLNFYIGAVFSIIYEWLMSGTNETPDELAEIIVFYLNNGLAFYHNINNS